MVTETVLQSSPNCALTRSVCEPVFVGEERSVCVWKEQVTTADDVDRPKHLSVVNGEMDWDSDDVAAFQLERWHGAEGKPLVYEAMENVGEVTETSYS